MNAKSPRYSHTIMERAVLPADINGFNTLYGGKLMEWVDNIAGIVAARHSRRMSVTGSIDGLFFLSPIRLGDIVRLDAWVNYVTRSTMEIEVDVVTEESMTGVKKLTTKAFLTYVAVDSEGRPVEVPRLRPGTREERARFREGKRRSRMRQQRLKEVRADAAKFKL